MTLVDAGPLVALIDRDDRDHERCAAVLTRLAAPLVTTWPAFTEAMYLLGRRVGWIGQEGLWRLLRRADLVVYDIDASTVMRVAELMHKYRDRPMDLADASLVALAEAKGLRRVFTLDSDFAVYRLKGTMRFRLVP